ncbi:MAG: amidohydrolase [Mogibacterium sp.]|nr:amidohydrolase [Mogibacterium sp.]
MDVKQVAAKYADYVIKIRRQIHENPEESGKEFETAKLVRDELTKAGIEWEQCGTVCETGTKAIIRGGKPGKTVLLRGDMDALTVVEDTGLPFASKKPGMMHACGHDCHTSTLLTAALILNEMKDELPGTVVLAFQPAEETAVGAKDMLGAGVMDGVDAAFGMHVWGGVPVGTFNCQAGPRMAAARWFEIKITGKSGHGALPHECKDAIVAGSAMVQGFQQLVSRYYSPSEPVVITVGEFKSGTRWNVVSGEALLTGTTRCYNNDIHQNIIGEMMRVANGIADAYGVKAELIKDVDCTQPTINDPYVTQIAFKAAEKILGEGSGIETPATTGGEDFSFFNNYAPCAFMFLGISDEQKCYANHHPKFDVDESALIKGAEIYAQVAIDYNSAE